MIRGVAEIEIETGIATAAAARENPTDGIAIESVATKVFGYALYR